MSLKKQHRCPPETQPRESILGVIGGSGLYQLEGTTIVEEHDLDTPFGKPSDVVFEGAVAGNSRKVFFLSRHGRGHKYLPTEVNYRANIHALKQCGVTHILAVSAVGIMQENIHPGDLVLPDQIFDRTKGQRASTFFGDGLAGHVSFADPFCADFRQVVLTAGKGAGAKIHDKGVYICMEGPQFSTRAESNFYRQALNAAVIGMTALPEAKLAREAECSYALLALATDYDCWHESEADVSVEAVLGVLKANVALANRVVGRVAAGLPSLTVCPCHFSARNAMMTSPKMIPASTREKLAVLYSKYWH